MKKAKPVHGADLVLKARNIDSNVRIPYNDQPDFERIANEFGIFEEWKVISVVTWRISDDFSSFLQVALEIIINRRHSFKPRC